MSVLDQTSKDLSVARVVMHKLDGTFKDFQSHCYSVFALGSQWQTLLSSFAAANNSLEKRVEEVEAKEREVDMAKNMLQNLQKEVELRRKKLESEEKSLSERIGEMELREKQVMDWRDCLEFEKGEVLERCRAVEVREKRFLERVKAVEERESEVRNRDEALDVKDKELNLKESMLEQNKVKFDEDRKELDLKEEEIDEICTSLVLKEREMKERSEKLLSKEKEIDEHNKVLEAKEKAMELEQYRINESSKLMEMKEKEIERFLELYSKETQIYNHQNDLGLKDEQIERHISKEKEVDEQLDEVLEKQGDVQCIASHCQTQELREKQSGSSSLTHLSQEKELPDIQQVVCSIDSSSPSIGGDIYLLCRNMDADGLRSYLTEHHLKGKFIVHDKILDALRYAPDPGKLVIEVTRSSSHQIFVDKAELIADENSCILLLMQFMKLSPPITPEVEEEAKNFADFLNARLISMGNSNTPADNFGFLQFVAAFKLASFYDPHQLIFLFRKFYSGHEVYRKGQLACLCRALGLSKMIPGIIKSFIVKKKFLSAVKYACVFKLQYKFPPVPLLQAYLDLSNKKVNEKQKNGTLKSKIEAGRTEFSILQEVTNCITKFKLESKFPPDSLVSRMKELQEWTPEAIKLLEKRSASSCDFVSSPKQLQKRPRYAECTAPSQPPAN